MSVTELVGPAGNPSADVPLPEPRTEPPEQPSFSPGTRVQVRRRFDDKWASGFEVAETSPLGYRLRRLSDGEMIPVPFPADVVRREKKRSTWWY